MGPRVWAQNREARYGTQGRGAEQRGKVWDAGYGRRTGRQGMESKVGAQNKEAWYWSQGRGEEQGGKVWGAKWAQK